MKNAFKNIVRSYTSTLTGILLIMLDIFFFFIIRLIVDCEPLSLTSFIVILIVGIALCFLNEEGLKKYLELGFLWIKKKLSDS